MARQTPTVGYELGDLNPDKVHRELQRIAVCCSVTEKAVGSLRRQGRLDDIKPGDPWPFEPTDAAAPVGSKGWWSWATTVLAVAHNTGLITMHTRNGLLNDAYAVALARGGVL